MSDEGRKNGDGSSLETIQKYREKDDARGAVLEVWLKETGYPAAMMQPVGLGLSPVEAVVALAYATFDIAEAVGVEADGLFETVRKMKETSYSFSDSVGVDLTGKN